MAFLDSAQRTHAGGLVQPIVRLLFVLLLLVAAAAAAVEKMDEGQEVTSAVFDRQIPGALQEQAKKFADVYLPTAVAPDSPCGLALQAMYEALVDNNTIMWAKNMVDSWGKSSDGILFGNFMFTGLYDECVYAASPDGGVKGKYCIVTTDVIVEQQRSLASRNRLMPNAVPQGPWLGQPLQQGSKESRTIVDSLNSSDTHYGTCMPDVCTVNDLIMSLRNNNLLDSEISIFATCFTNNQKPQFTDGDAGFTGLITFIITLIICSSLVDMYLTYVDNTKLRKTSLRYLLVFSAYTNLYKMMQINSNPAPGTITCLNGVRVLSMTWVIYSHQQGTTFFNTANLLDVRKWAGGLLAQTISNGYPSVDTFFFISGLLVAYSVLRQLDKRGQFNAGLYIFHRFMRLIPPIGIVAGLMATVLAYFVSGPYSTIWTAYWQQNCVNYWWKDITFINNFIYDKDCVAQAWYVAVDTQLYLIAPFVILPLFFFEAAGKAWLFIVTILSAVIPSIIIYVNDYPPTSLMYGPEGNTEYFDYVYLMPWCRAAPWMMGAWVGYIFYKQGDKRVKMSALIVTVGWTLASITGLLVVYGLVSYNHFFDPTPYEAMTQIVYGGGHRLAWGAALGWLVFACHNGYGGVVDEFLSHLVWQPISRLTYSIYLVAFPVQFAIAYNLRVASYYNYINKIIETVGALVISFPLAVLLSLIAESPVMGLERLLLRPNTQPRKKETSSPPRDKNETVEFTEREDAGVDNKTFIHDPEGTAEGGKDEEAKAGWEKVNGGEHDKKRETNQNVTSL